VQWFTGTYGLVALIGAVIGLLAARKWGGLKTVLGKSLTLFSLGLLAQEAGQLTYQYYIYVKKIDIPYPSWGDAAYFGSVVLYILAALFLARAAGTKFSLKHTKHKAVALIIPLGLLITSYMVFLKGYVFDASHPLTVFLDFGYPLGQAFYISIAITAYLVSRKMLGGIMRSGVVLIILALFIQYIADFSFIYQSSREQYVAGGYVDMLYLTAYFAMTMAMVRFHTAYSNLRQPRAVSPSKDKEAAQ
jgi:hypothetical protein